MDAILKLIGLGELVEWKTQIAIGLPVVVAVVWSLVAWLRARLQINVIRSLAKLPNDPETNKQKAQIAAGILTGGNLEKFQAIFKDKKARALRDPAEGKRK